MDSIYQNHICCSLWNLYWTWFGKMVQKVEVEIYPIHHMVYNRLKEKYPFNNIPLDKYWKEVLSIRIKKSDEDIKNRIGTFLLQEFLLSPVQVDRINDMIIRMFRLKKIDARYLLNDFQKLGWVKKDNYSVVLLKDTEAFTPNGNGIECGYFINDAVSITTD